MLVVACGPRQLPRQGGGFSAAAAGGKSGRSLQEMEARSPRHDRKPGFDRVIGGMDGFQAGDFGRRRTSPLLPLRVPHHADGRLPSVILKTADVPEASLC